MTLDDVERMVCSIAPNLEPISISLNMDAIVFRAPHLESYLTFSGRELMQANNKADFILQKLNRYLKAAS